MFVEQFSWTVNRSQKESSQQILQMLCHYMDSSGGLIRALSGEDLNNPDSLTCLSFWKSWDDLSRFLVSHKSACLDEISKQQAAGKVKPHHFEAIWHWPGEITDDLNHQSCFAVHDFSADEGKMDILFDSLRHAVPRLQSHKGFHSASLWVDKNNSGHAVMATRWSESSPDDSIIDAVVLVATVKAKVTEAHRKVFKLHNHIPRLVSTG